MSGDWTPYALERYRIQHLRRRRLAAIAAAVLLLLLVGTFFSVSTDRQTRISANGRDAQGNSIEIQDVDRDKDRKDHVTVSIAPGRVSRVETGTDNQPPQVSRAQAPQFGRAAPYNWSFYLLLYGPYVLVGLLFWLLGKRRSRHDEVNYGVYKGAMPLEMVTASLKDAVVTRRFTRSSVFGKGRDDHLPRGFAAMKGDEGG